MVGNDSPIRKKALSGVVWNLVDAVGRKGIVFGIQIMLARILEPNEFGIIGMVTVFIVIAEAIAECGMSNAIIREQNTTQDEYSLVFFLNTGLAFLLYFALIFFSKWIAIYYEEPQLVEIIPVIGLVIIFNAMSAIPKALLIKQMLFRKQALISILSVGLAGTVALIAAHEGYGIWALVFNNLLVSFFEVILGLFATRWVPKLKFRCNSFSKYFRFGWKVLVATIISSVYESVYAFIIGKRYSAVELGLYTNASKISGTLASAISQVAQKVSLPVMSQIQDENEMLKTAYGKILKYSAYLCFPAMIGLLSISDMFVLGFLGEKWVPAIPYLKLLCIIGMMTPIHRINLNVLYVKGRSDLVLRVEILKKFVGISLIAIACVVTNDVMQMLVFSVLYEVIAFIINAYYSEKLIGYSAKKQISDLNRIIFATAIMGLVVCSIKNIHEIWWLVLLIQITVGVFLYCILTFLFEQQIVKELLSIIMSFIKGNRNDQAKD